MLQQLSLPGPPKGRPGPCSFSRESGEDGEWGRPALCCGVLKTGVESAAWKFPFTCRSKTEASVTERKKRCQPSSLRLGASRSQWAVRVAEGESVLHSSTKTPQKKHPQKAHVATHGCPHRVRSPISRTLSNRPTQILSIFHTPQITTSTDSKDNLLSYT